ncbi:putative E3 ubiquitin protein ligase [Zancudomyces culisetae]|uniref:HECT-type E3 ubiquitin transferase n=1 Tax=Zancudomyces culisetae TaxID=1213189 RepID=A0A1R1PZ04_ZANCU|nr:putative E3 ubiquitin protein ligase [Zancudomyces culisetae]|eukprot:OMH86171.1 putative E3 ubiquitin protein ligase [Zancudomyces culisetae]
MFLHSSMHLDQGVALTVRRDKVFYDGFNVLSPILLGNAQSTDNEHNENYHYSSMINHLSPGDGFKLDFKINFIDAHGFNEPGIDGGGVYREFMESTQDYIFDIKNNLFSLTENTESITDVGGNSVEKQQQYRLHPTEFVNGSEGGREERCQMLRYSGAIVAKTLVNYRLVKLPLRFSDFFLKRWLGLSFGLEDLAEYDYELYKGLVELYTKSKDKASQVDLLYGLDFTVSADKSFVYDLDTLGLKKHSTELENLNFNVINYDSGSKGKYGVDFPLVKLTRENFNNFKQVTNESVEYYIHQMVSFKLNNLNFSESQMAFLDGVFSIIPFSFYRALFASPNELNTFLTGMANYSEGMELLNGSSCYSSIDIADWKANTVYSGLFDQPQPNNYFGAFTADSERAKGKVEEDRKKHLKTIEMFWDIVENSLQDNEKRLLLKFVTSSELPPQGGFSNLNPKFCIQGIPLTTEQSPNVSGPDHNPSSSPGSSSTNQLEAGSFEYEFKCGRLPSSSTCVNLLKLPVYSNRAVLKEKLLYAINSKSGFLLS